MPWLYVGSGGEYWHTPGAGRPVRGKPAQQRRYLTVLPHGHGVADTEVVQAPGELGTVGGLGLILAREGRCHAPRRLCITGFVIDYVGYFCDALKPWIARRGQLGRFVIRRDPRDISRIWVLDPDGATYLQVPYRTLSHPPISAWEQRAAVARLREQGRAQVDEDALFRMAGQMRRSPRPRRRRPARPAATPSAVPPHRRARRGGTGRAARPR